MSARKQSFLELLPPGAGAALLAVARPLSFPSGAVLIRFGQLATGAYVLRSGSVSVMRAMPGGELLPIASLQSGAMLGEMALVEQGRCSATVVAVSEVEALFVESEVFRALVALPGETAAVLQTAMTGGLISRLRELERRIVDCALLLDESCLPPLVRPVPIVASEDRAPLRFDVPAFLSRVAFLLCQGEEEMAALCSLGRLRWLERGELVDVAGDHEPACFLVVRGALELIRRTDAGQWRLAVVGPGHLVGLVELLGVRDDESRRSIVRARERSVLMEIAGAPFRELYGGQTSLSLKVQRLVHHNLLRAIASSNTHLTRLVSEMSLRGIGHEFNPDVAM